MPEITVSMTAIIVAVIAHFLLGFLWYTPLFGKAWGKEMGYDPNEQPDKSLMIKGMLTMLIGNFLMAWVLGHNMAAYNPETWGQTSTMSSSMMASMAAIFTWLGFFFPVDIGSVFWEKKSWKLFGINTSYHFLSLFIVAQIIANV